MGSGQGEGGVREIKGSGSGGIREMKRSGRGGVREIKGSGSGGIREMKGSGREWGHGDQGVREGQSGGGFKRKLGDHHRRHQPQHNSLPLWRTTTRTMVRTIKTRSRISPASTALPGTGTSENSGYNS